MIRTAHYVRSSHWDREWYEPVQGFRLRLVAVLDGVLDLLAADPAFRYTMDGQSIPIDDYLEVRPERADDVGRHARDGRLKVGPWYTAPDEWLVSGESLVRNLEMGIARAAGLGGPACRAGLLCDQFGHVGQLPQVFDQFGIGVAYVWRGTSERQLGGHFLWQSPDGTRLPTYRFGKRGYGGLAYAVRNVFADQGPFDPHEAVDRLVAYTRAEAARSPLSPILLYDGADHLEVEPRMAQTIAAANDRLRGDGIHIVASDLDAYGAEVLREQPMIAKTVVGELRETSGDAVEGTDGGDEQWLIGGTYASRIHLKQRNAACEDELCLWAEPFCTFAAESLGVEYPASLLDIAWRHLLENHPHDSMCGCSTDQVHQDMIYRFDQSIAISSRLAERAMTALTAAAAAAADGPTIGLFNATAEPIDEPVDFDVHLPEAWPTKFAEFFGFEQKFGFRLRGPDGVDVAYQLVAQQRDVPWRRTVPYKLSAGGSHHRITVCARVPVPAFGYTTLHVEPVAGPTRHPGTLASSHRSVENDLLRATVNPNGTLRVEDKRTGTTFDQLLTVEERADIGDGWFHGVAVNDEVHTSGAAAADVAVVADGRFRSTLRVTVTLDVPATFDFARMRRSEQRVPLRLASEVTLRAGSDRVEVTTTLDNAAESHRVRMLFPTGLTGEAFESDSAFDVVRRSVALRADNHERRELDLETRPHQSWTAFGDGKAGLAVIARGLPEVAVTDTPDRAIALTLLRGFRRVISRPDDRGGQVLGPHRFRYDLVPFAGPTPVKRLFLLGQRLHGTVRQASVAAPAGPASLPRSKGFARVEGDVVVTSVRRDRGRRTVRVFNPSVEPTSVVLDADVDRITLDGRPEGHMQGGARRSRWRASGSPPSGFAVHERTPTRRSARRDAEPERLPRLERGGQLEVLERRSAGNGHVRGPEDGTPVDPCRDAGPVGGRPGLNRLPPLVPPSRRHVGRDGRPVGVARGRHDHLPVGVAEVGRRPFNPRVEPPAVDRRAAESVDRLDGAVPQVHVPQPREVPHRGRQHARRHRRPSGRRERAEPHLLWPVAAERDLGDRLGAVVEPLDEHPDAQHGRSTIALNHATRRHGRERRRVSQIYGVRRPHRFAGLAVDVADLQFGQVAGVADDRLDGDEVEDAVLALAEVRGEHADQAPRRTADIGPEADRNPAADAPPREVGRGSGRADERVGRIRRPGDRDRQPQQQGRQAKTGKVGHV